MLEEHEDRDVTLSNYRSGDMSSSLLSPAPEQMRSSSSRLRGDERVVNCPALGTEGQRSLSWSQAQQLVLLGTVNHLQSCPLIIQQFVFDFLHKV